MGKIAGIMLAISLGFARVCARFVTSTVMSGVAEMAADGIAVEMV